MTTDELRRELDRIADGAPAVDLPDDTWTRARRSVVRERAAVVGASLAVVAAIAAGFTWLPDRAEPPVAADSSALGVPDHLYDPQRLVVSSDLEIGAAAVAWARGRDIVAVGGDGTYHLLRPEGFVDLFRSDQAFALSPDGTRLAYAWGDDDANRAYGVKVADLNTGRVQDFAIPDLPTAVQQITWSADGRWLAWSGLNVTTSEGGGFKGTGPVVGRVVPGAGKAQTLGAGLEDVNSSLAITDDGVVLLASTESLVRVTPSDRQVTEVSFGRLSTTAVVDPSTGLIGFGVGGNGPSDEPAPGTLAVLVDPVTGTEQRIGGAAAGEDPRSHPLGFVGSTLVIAVRDGNGDDPRLELVAKGLEQRRVAVMDAAVPTEISVATDLMTLDRPTVTRDEPDWPIDWGAWWIWGLIGLGVAAALVVFAAVRSSRRERGQLRESTGADVATPVERAEVSRQQRRVRHRVGGIALAVVAATGAGFAWWPEGAQSTDADANGAVPNRIELITAEMMHRDEDQEDSTDDFDHELVTDDLTIGQGAVAYVAETGLPVVIDADQGEYHLLDLPDFIGNNPEAARLRAGPTVSLSPDGRQLAYGYAELAGNPYMSKVTKQSGVRIVDLDSGDVRTVELDAPVRGAVAVTGFSWSPDGRWLLWFGTEVEIWDSLLLQNPTNAVGRIGPDGAADRLKYFVTSAYAIDPEGGVAIARPDELRFVPVIGAPVTVPRSETDSESTFAVAAQATNEDVDLPNEYYFQVLRTVDTDYTYRVDAYPYIITADTVHRSDPVDVDGRVIEPIGWLDHDRILVRAGAVLASGSVELTDLVVIDVHDKATTKVGSVAEDVPYLSVATGLLDGQSTVERPVPRWAKPWWGIPPVLLVGPGLAGAIAVLLALRWLWRRRTAHVTLS